MIIVIIFFWYCKHITDILYEKELSCVENTW